VVLGDIDALEEVRLLSTGRVLGNISTPQLTVEPGVVVKGSITITAGQKKDVEKIIEDAYVAGPAIDFVEDNKRKGSELKIREATTK